MCIIYVIFSKTILIFNEMDIIDKYIGRKLRSARILKRMTQSELGSIVGVTLQQIQKYEKGLNRISAGRLYEFSRSLGVGIVHFYDGDIEYLYRDGKKVDIDLLDKVDLNEIIYSNIKKRDHKSNQLLSDSCKKTSNEIDFFQKSKHDSTDSNLIALIKYYENIKSDSVKKKIIDLIKVISTDR